MSIFKDKYIFLLQSHVALFKLWFCLHSSSIAREPLSKKDVEFRSIFQHIQSAQLRRSPSELFNQHVVSIVHYIKGRVRSVLVSADLLR